MDEKKSTPTLLSTPNPTIPGLLQPFELDTHIDEYVKTLWDKPDQPLGWRAEAEQYKITLQAFPELLPFIGTKSMLTTVLAVLPDLVREKGQPQWLREEKSDVKKEEKNNVNSTAPTQISATAHVYTQLMHTILTGLALGPDKAPESESALTYAQAVALLGRANFTPRQVRFLSNCLQKKPAFQRALFALIKRSKTDKSVAIASANAATILNTCQIKFMDKDWQGVELAGAYLPYAQFTNSDLQDANLRDAYLVGTQWHRSQLNGADLSNAIWEEGVQWPLVGYQTCSHHPSQPWLAVVVDGREIYLRHNETGKEIREFTRSILAYTINKYTYKLAFSTDGKYLVSVHRLNFTSTEMSVWNVSTGQLIRTVGDIQLHHLRTLVFISNELLVTSAEYDKENGLKLWNIHGEYLGSVLNDLPFVGATAFCPSKNLLALRTTKDRKTVIESYQTDVGNILTSPDTAVTKTTSFTLTKLASELAFSPDSRWLIAGPQSPHDILHLFNITTSRLEGTLMVGDATFKAFDGSAVMFAADMPDHVLLVCKDTRTSFKMLKLNIFNQLELSALPMDNHTQDLENVRFIQDKKKRLKLTSSSLDGTIRVWDTPTGRFLKRRNYTTPASIKISDNHWVDVVVDSPTNTYQASAHSISQPAPSISNPGQTSYCVVQVEYIVQVNAIKEGQNRGEQIASFKGHIGEINSIAFSPINEELLASGGYDKTVRVWDAKNKQPSGEPLEGHTGAVESIAFSPDGQWLASGSRDKTVRLWNMSTRHCANIIPWHNPIYSIAIAPDPENPTSWLLAIGDSIGVLSVWQVSSQKKEDKDHKKDSNKDSSDITVHFRWMSSHLGMPLCFNNISLHGCKIDSQSAPVLRAHGVTADEMKAIVAIKEEKKPTVSTSPVPTPQTQERSTRIPHAPPIKILNTSVVPDYFSSNHSSSFFTSSSSSMIATTSTSTTSSTSIGEIPAKTNVNSLPEEQNTETDTSLKPSDTTIF